jgi:hypothetical protein
MTDRSITLPRVAVKLLPLLLPCEPWSINMIPKEKRIADDLQGDQTGTRGDGEEHGESEAGVEAGEGPLMQALEEGPHHHLRPQSISKKPDDTHNLCASL